MERTRFGVDLGTATGNQSQVDADSGLPPVRSKVLRYAASIATAPLALAARLALNPLLGLDAPYSTFYLATALTAYLAGLWPAMFTAVLGAILADYYFIPPLGSFGRLTTSKAIWESLYLVISAAIVVGIDRQRKLRVRAEAAVRALKQSQQALISSENRLHAVILKTELGTWEFDPQTGAVTCSEFVRQHFGLPVAAAVDNDTFLRGIHPLDRERVHQLVQNALRPESGGQYATEYRTIGLADGQERWIAVWGHVFFDSSGKPVRFGGFTRDISEYKRLEERLLEAQRRESLGLLSSGIAHEFNNLLQVIVGNATLLLDEVASSSSPELAEIIDASQRAGALTKQLLAYAGEGRFVVQDLDVSRVVEEVMQQLGPSLPKNIEIRLDLAAELPFVAMDASQLSQVIKNLIQNAVEAIGAKEGGSILVSTRMQEIDESFLREYRRRTSARPGKFVVLEVCDNGCGMDEAVKSRIFEPFFTTKFVGRGLGLAAVSGVAGAHGGLVMVDTAVGVGSRFSVLLPAAEL
jgi:PAS domain S-box-containing protein